MSSKFEQILNSNILLVKKVIKLVKKNYTIHDIIPSSDF